MPKRSDKQVEFGRVGRRVFEAAFHGGDIVSDGGVLLLKRVNEHLGLTRAVALAFSDERAAALHAELMQQFIARHAQAPKELVLDVDATHVPLHGLQERGKGGVHSPVSSLCMRTAWRGMTRPTATGITNRC